MWKREAFVGILLLSCTLTAADPRPAESARRLTVDYDLEFATPGSEAIKVQLKVSGPISKPLHTTLTGIGNYHVEIETTEIPGGETQFKTTQYKTKWHVTERDDRGCITGIVARPQVLSLRNQPASIVISDGHGEDRKFTAAVYESK